MIEYLEEALDFYLGEISEVDRNTRVSRPGSVNSTGLTRAVENPTLTDSKPELKLWEVEP